MEEDTFFVESGGGDVDTDGGQRRRMAIASIPQEPIQQRAITTATVQQRAITTASPTEGHHHSQSNRVGQGHWG